jgi:uncharacterized glyoxalase superfamily protein PhnB
MLHASTGEIATSVIPVLRYRNLPAAIDWLCQAFGFEKQRVTAGKNGSVQFAQLTFGTAMIMLGPVRSSAFDKLLKQPDEIGGAETQVCYFFVADARTHFARAKAAGAEIVFNVEDQANGGRSYSCRDPEGHLWNFGTYNPWPRPPIARPQPAPQQRQLGGAVKHVAVASIMLVIIAIAAAAKTSVVVQTTLREFAGMTLATASPENDAQLTPAWQARQQNVNSATRPTGEEPLTAARPPQEEVERALIDVRRQLTRALSEKAEAERTAVDANKQLAQALGEKQAAEQNAKDVQERLVRTWISRTVAERVAKAARQQLARERSARKAMENARPAIAQQHQPSLPLWP